jgi:DMSO/TMAO reductase YedYZ molybdopterin-dependent catalytic subunit
MAKDFVSRGFVGKRRDAAVADRVPPGQYLTPDFPVLSAGPTPRTPLERWSFSIEGLVHSPVKWSWAEFLKLPTQSFVVDIHCVTKWSKLDTHWEGVSLDVLFKSAEVDPKAHFLTAYSDGDYTTNMPLAEVLGGQAFVAHTYDGKPLAAEHGGPARLVVPHLYFWKSAKWVRGLRLSEMDEPGFWEALGYNNHGDPWKEERYSGA